MAALPKISGLHIYFYEHYGVHKTDSKCSNTNPPEADAAFESVFALLC